MQGKKKRKILWQNPMRIYDPNDKFYFDITILEILSWPRLTI